jgi:hypothetical protein
LHKESDHKGETDTPTKVGGSEVTQTPAGGGKN